MLKFVMVEKKLMMFEGCRNSAPRAPPFLQFSPVLYPGHGCSEGELGRAWQTECSVHADDSLRKT